LRSQAGEVVLLSGGSPQIAKGHGDAPVQAYIAAMPYSRRSAARTTNQKVSAWTDETLPAIRRNNRQEIATHMILVTGASGHVGGMALRCLSAMGCPVAAMARNPRKAEETVPAGVPIRIANYDDVASLKISFEGVSSLLFVASDGDGRDVLRHHANVIDAAAATSIKQVIFMSILDIEETSQFYYTPVYRDAERRLTESGLSCTILRCGLYSDLLLSHWIEPARATGELWLPVGQARIAPVSRKDVAAAAASLTAAADRDGKVYELTGPKAYSFDEIADLANEVFGTRIRYVSCSTSDYLRRAWAEMQDPWPHAFTTLCASIGEGRYAGVSTDIADLLGRPAEDLRDFLVRYAVA
jgi:NAD(P)H dehydrogenase (quinone)